MFTLQTHCPLQVDRSLVLSEGKIVMGKLLIELQVRKSTADGTGAQNFYTDLTAPMDIFTEEVRNLVLSKKLVSILWFCHLYRRRTY
jgi:dipeptidyl-peptidase-3